MAGHAMTAARAALARVRERGAKEVRQREHTATAIVACTALGYSEAKGHKLPEVLGIDGKLLFGGLLVLGADHVGGRTGRMMQSAGDGLLSTYGYLTGRTLGGAAKISGADGDGTAFIENLLKQ